MTWLWTVVACWAALSIPAALVLSRAIQLADQRETTGHWCLGVDHRESGFPDVRPFPFTGESLTG